ncbi:ATP-binding cassette transporter abc1 [Plectosphaerella plurivora]|uniref:ATP-binding cassette transporter abc1 n=1 Tax=Plectosphaerella plurivora TaxID=936078 RepID=A0A9P8V493_9PEZI|nr:ATP-binding cassette transporter abc1 [Plectosphaerella plurivora]
MGLIDAPFDVAALLSAAVPDRQQTLTLQSKESLSWISDITIVAESGFPQALVILISLLWASFRLLNRRYPKRLVSQHRASGIRWRWEICSQISRTLAVGFISVAAARGQTNRLNAVCAVYALTFGLLRLANDLEWRHIALHQTNLVLTCTFVLLAGSSMLPCVEAHQQCAFSMPIRGSLASLLASVLIAIFTPREWVPPYLRYAAAEGRDGDGDPAPEEICSWADYFITYDWLTPLIWKGSRTQITIDDLPKLPWYDSPRLLLSQIRKGRTRSRTTIWTTLSLVRKELALMACCNVTSNLFELIAPFALYHLLSYLADPQDAAIRPWVWLMLMFCGPLSRSIVSQQYVFMSTRLIVRIKTALTQELYHRAMFSMELDDTIFTASASSEKSKKKSAQSSNSTGRLANLMAADVEAVYESRNIIMVLFGLPTGVIVSLIGMYKMLGWPSLVGAFVLIFTSPVSVIIGQMMVRATRVVRKAQDTRISLISEYMSSIRAIKYFAWEDAVSGKIQEARDTEQRQLWRVTVLFVFLNQITQTIPFISLLLTFTLFVAVKKESLTAATAFTTVFLMKQIRKNITQAVSLSRRLTAASVAFRRLDKYFESTVPLQTYPQGPLALREASFRRAKSATFELQDLTVDFAQGGLNVVSGQSGSGKTTLLLAILGEAEKLGGAITRPRDVAFASQTPWLQNETIRKNILFNSAFEPTRYEAIIDACCLRLDIGQMPEGDQTTVGENGASLSGGQKARVALARALYSKAPLILLDDVFSALDAKTSALLWERCFCTDMLRDRTTVLVAQQPWLPEQADLSIHLEDGKIAEVKQNIGVVRHPIVAAQEPAEDADTPEPELEARHDAFNEASVAPEKNGDVVADEMKGGSGNSTRLLFFKYMTYFGSPMYAIFCIMVMVLTNAAWMASTLWLSIWVDASSRGEAVNIAFYLGIYSVFAFGEIIGYAAVILVFENGAWHAARRLHHDFLQAIMKVSLSWYEKVPVGRVINRFSRDMNSIDSSISGQLQRFLDNAQGILFRLGAISSIMPIFVVPAAVTCSVGVIVGEMYTRTAVTIKKLVSSAQSPVFTQFSDTLAGLAVIRAREGMPEAFADMLADRLAMWSRAAEANYNCNRWVAMRVDVITALVALCAGIIAVSKAGSVAAGLVGFSLTNATGLSSTIISMVRSMNDLEVELQSFVRVREYAALRSEDEGDKNHPEEGEYADDEREVIPKQWPATGKIEFRNVTIRYDVNGPDILTDVSLTFNAGERVAVIGRTGSGKSTLILSLLRFTHIVSGQILYDGVDITRIPRRRLREGLTIIPQEAVLFNGTVGSNLDPTGKTSETELEKVIDSCQDIASFQHTTNGHGNGVLANGNGNGNGHGHEHGATGGLALSTSVTPKGENFSHGQRQVLSLCRALVRKSKLMLLDEATASMDYETDRGIQQALRREMDEAGGERTLVTIAHRLRTIIDYDKVVVMGAGRVVEAGAPRELYERRGVFFDMVYHSGEGDELRETLGEVEMPRM